MTKPTGIDWLNNSFIVAHRADQAPSPLPVPVFHSRCSQCGTKTLTEQEYPKDIPIVCNVCAREVVKTLEKDDATELLYNLPADVKARLLDIAFAKRLPVEAVVRDFLAWKLGHVPKATLQTPSEPKKRRM